MSFFLCTNTIPFGTVHDITIGGGTGWRYDYVIRIQFEDRLQVNLSEETRHIISDTHSPGFAYHIAV